MLTPEKVYSRGMKQADRMLADPVVMERHARAISRAVSATIDAYCTRLVAAGKRVAVRERALGVIGVADDPNQPYCLSVRSDIAILAPGAPAPEGWTIYEERQG